MAGTVLVIDDEPGILQSLSRILEDEGYRPLLAARGEEGLAAYRTHAPDVVLLDVWLPDRDGLEILRLIRESDPSAAVVMMSGHGDVQTAVESMKRGAFDYLEKPPSYDRVVGVIRGALAARRGAAVEAPSGDLTLESIPASPLLRDSKQPQRTLAASTVLYGLGLHSGTRTGLAMQPLPPDSGLHFISQPRGVPIPVHVSAAGNTEYATTLTRRGESIKTVEHLLSALHARGITNLLIKVHGEVPVLDGSAIEFCKHFDEVGVVDQDAPRREIVIDRVYEVNVGEGRALRIEPAERLSVSYFLKYPPPVGEQTCDFELVDFDRYVAEVAPARTFGFLKDVKMLNELGLGSGGRLDNFILIGDDQVINTELRFPDEFVRHKVLDLIGDLTLCGYPVRGKVTARLTGHRHNIALVKAILG